MKFTKTCGCIVEHIPPTGGAANAIDGTEVIISYCEGHNPDNLIKILQNHA